MSTTLPHGIIQINEGNIAWYGDITANWQLIDSKIGEYDAAVASIPAPANNGTLTINYGDTTIAMFGADDAGDVSADIPAPGDGALTVTQGGSAMFLQIYPLRETALSRSPREDLPSGPLARTRRRRKQSTSRHRETALSQLSREYLHLGPLERTRGLTA